MNSSSRGTTLLVILVVGGICLLIVSNMDSPLLRGSGGCFINIAGNNSCNVSIVQTIGTGVDAWVNGAIVLVLAAIGFFGAAYIFGKLFGRPQ